MSVLLAETVAVHHQGRKHLRDWEADEAPLCKEHKASHPAEKDMLFLVKSKTATHLAAADKLGMELGQMLDSCRSHEEEISECQENIDRYVVDLAQVAASVQCCTGYLETRQFDITLLDNQIRELDRIRRAKIAEIDQIHAMKQDLELLATKKKERLEKETAREMGAVSRYVQVVDAVQDFIKKSPLVSRIHDMVPAQVDAPKYASETTAPRDVACLDLTIKGRDMSKDLVPTPTETKCCI